MANGNYQFETYNDGPFMVHFAKIVKGFEHELIISNPNPSNFLSMTTTVLEGSLSVDVSAEGFEPFTAISYAGDHVNYKPRDGMDGYGVEVTALLTMLEDVTYVCIRCSEERKMDQTKIIYSEPITITEDSLVICLNDYSVNDVNYTTKKPVLVKQGDVITAPLDSIVIIYTASWR